MLLKNRHEGTGNKATESRQEKRTTKFGPSRAAKLTVNERQAGCLSAAKQGGTAKAGFSSLRLG